MLLFVYPCTHTYSSKYVHLVVSALTVTLNIQKTGNWLPPGRGVGSYLLDSKGDAYFLPESSLLSFELYTMCMYRLLILLFERKPNKHTAPYFLYTREIK